MELMMLPSLLRGHARGLRFIVVHGSERFPDVPAFFRKYLLDIGKLPSSMRQALDRDHGRGMAPVSRQRIADLQRWALFGWPPFQQLADILPGVLASAHVQHHGRLRFIGTVGDDAGGMQAMSLAVSSPLLVLLVAGENLRPRIIADQHAGLCR